MKKLYLLLLVAFATITNCYSQEVYFLTGSNFTKYLFKSSNSSASTKLQNGTGTTYEMGYAAPLKNKNLSYSAGLSLNDYNALAGSTSNSYSWNTKYLGVQGAINYNFLQTGSFLFAVKGGVNMSTILYGKQEINGAVYDLVGQEEFSRLIFQPFTGLHLKYEVRDLGHLSLGYGLSKSFDPFNNSSEKVSFLTNQILFGLHFNINNY